jgi:hypothetical protein
MEYILMFYKRIIVCNKKYKYSHFSFSNEGIFPVSLFILKDIFMSRYDFGVANTCAADFISKNTYILEWNAVFGNIL